MKLCVLAPTQEYLGQAGVRIRYLRIAEHLQALGHELSVQVIDQFKSAAQFNHDAYLFSKCYDGRCHVVTLMLRQNGKLVGVDMFDDYFSQLDDSRFLGHREWLRGMARHLDFYLCSTPRMQDVMSGYLPETPGHILNDPFDAADPGAIAQSALANLERTHAQGELQVAWFGVGDNPHFAVGLRDLLAFSHGLALLDRGRMQVRLRILTNRRALNADGLALLGRLPVPWSVDEWSVEAERQLLASSLVAFIPVNAQPFSAAKSLNRAVSALTAGTQILSNGYPLYQPLSDFVYRRPQDLLADLEDRSLKLRPDTVPGLMDLLATYGDPVREARAFGDFLSGLPQGRPHPSSAADAKLVKPDPANATEAQDPLLAVGAVGAPAILGVVHGVKSSVIVHKFVQRVRHLSIGSPFCSPELNYDLQFLGAGASGDSNGRVDAMTGPGRAEGPLTAQFSEFGSTFLRADLAQDLVAGTSATGRPVKSLPVASMWPELAGMVQAGLRCRSRAEKLALYAPVMAAVCELTRCITQGVQPLVSETEPPFRARQEAA